MEKPNLVYCKNPQCHTLHENLDKSGYCESCWPETQYARGYENHPYQPQPIKDNNEL
jgi:hypothetical protein